MEDKFEVNRPIPMCMDCKNCSLCVYVANNLYSIKCKKKMCGSVIADKPMACSKFKWIHPVNKKKRKTTRQIRKTKRPNNQKE